MICSGVSRRRALCGTFPASATMTEAHEPHNYWTTTGGSFHCRRPKRFSLRRRRAVRERLALALGIAVHRSAGRRRLPRTRVLSPPGRRFPTTLPILRERRLLGARKGRLLRRRSVPLTRSSSSRGSRTRQIGRAHV